MEKIYNINIRLRGIRPIMFDRYAGDNNTSLAPQDKMYLDGNIVSIPSANVMSMLTAENTKSVTKVHYPPKAGVGIRQALSSFFLIDEEMIHLTDDGGQPIRFDGAWTDKIFIHRAVARVKGGVPNPKERPCVLAPWYAEFNAKWIENKVVSLDGLEGIFRKSCLIGLGTFRPQCGQFAIDMFKESAVD